MKSKTFLRTGTGTVRDRTPRVRPGATGLWTETWTWPQPCLATRDAQRIPALPGGENTARLLFPDLSHVPVRRARAGLQCPGPLSWHLEKKAGVRGNDNRRLTSRTFRFNITSDELLYTLKTPISLQKALSQTEVCSPRATPPRRTRNSLLLLQVVLESQTGRPVGSPTETHKLTSTQAVCLATHHDRHRLPWAPAPPSASPATPQLPRTHWTHLWAPGEETAPDMKTRGAHRPHCASSWAHSKPPSCRLRNNHAQGQSNHSPL